jgi:hypothetical protein
VPLGTTKVLILVAIKLSYFLEGPQAALIIMPSTCYRRQMRDYFYDTAIIFLMSILADDDI